MESSELRELLTPEALGLMDSLPPYTSSQDVVAMVAKLRKAGYSASLVASVLTQAKLRNKAQAKFGEFASRMLFTESGLEQATRLPVAAVHASRFVRAGLSEVWDLGCGIGADALACAAAGLNVTAVDRDEVTAAITTYNLAPFPNATVVCDNAETISIPSGVGVFLDPARRSADHSQATRLTNPDDYSPSLDFALSLGHHHPTGIKLGPGFDREQIPQGWEAQWVSHGGDVVEMTLWNRPLAREGITRSALVMTESGMHERSAAEDSVDAEVGPLGRYLYEPDGAIIRARLIGDLCREIHAHMIDPQIAYMTSDNLTLTPFAQAFEVIEHLKLEIKDINAALKKHTIGTVEIKKRGVDIDPAQFRKKLTLKGTESATLILTRMGKKKVALLAQRH